MADKKKVLITGGAGLIGSVVRDHLGHMYDFTSLDLKEADGARSFVANLSDLDAIMPAFEGQHTVVHLAADRRAYSDWDSNLPNNFVGTYNVYEAARQSGVQRVIFASSNHATGGYYLDPPWSYIARGEFDRVERPYPLVDETYRIRPDGYYGTAKAFGEALGSYYSDYHGLSAINLRIGWTISSDDPAFSPMALALWLSHRDTAQVVQKAIDAPESVKYETVYATSDNRWKILSLERAREVLGFQPQDGAGGEWQDAPPPPRDR
ncbi:MAG: NAD-dependent epimerase/dehydratase family protein [Chloroflexota bacterium]